MSAVGPFGLGLPELLIILAIVVLLFGATRLAGVGGSLGRGIREFRENLRKRNETGSNQRNNQEILAETCANCGVQLDFDAKFCAKCGRPRPANT